MSTIWQWQTRSSISGSNGDTCFHPFSGEWLGNTSYAFTFSVVKCVPLFLLYFHCCMSCLKTPFLRLLTNQIILRNIKAFCVLISPNFFLYISLIFFWPAQISPILRTEYFFYMHMTWICGKLAELSGNLVLFADNYQKRLLKIIYLNKIIYLKFTQIILIIFQKWKPCLPWSHEYNF